MIEQGTLNAGDIVRIAPKGIDNLKVFNIEMHHKTWPNAKPGDNVGMNIKGFEKNFMVSKPSKKEKGEGNSHITVKPLHLIEHLIKIFSKENSLVVDPFLGR